MNLAPAGVQCAEHSWRGRCEQRQGQAEADLTDLASIPIRFGPAMLLLVAHHMSSRGSYVSTTDVAYEWSERHLKAMGASHSSTESSRYAKRVLGCRKIFIGTGIPTVENRPFPAMFVSPVNPL